ncbi:response regulator transcription factor [Chroococcus sp. FPU101]|uniref:response regulator transcription factor n=1 Tax=Chroococcus sp. FPU101 TaxID=1974212 RepID=UPI001AA4D30A|nr:response regulator transcription factor [Chroococcus sp. FPU101]GFE72185.1 Two component Transcriptional regulator, Winged helix family [Chroococcus sp. FPU101]
MIAIACAKILIVDDDSAIRHLIMRFLSQKNYHVQGAADGKSALAVFEQFSPDLVILDVNLPDTLGYDLCEKMQALTNVYILILTSRTDFDDKRKGFLRGADDYITKPFDLEELDLRIRAILKRRRVVSSCEEKPLRFMNILIDPMRREVMMGSSGIALTSLEFDLLHCLAQEPGRVWSRAELIQKVWDYNYLGDHRVVDVHIGQIRKKIESDVEHPSIIQTIRGVGYKFIDAPLT